MVPGGGERKEESSEPVLIIDLEPKPSQEEEGAFRFSVGRAGRPAGWLREARRSAGCVMIEKDDEVRFEMPAARRVLVVDRATGFIRSMQVRDFDGTVREIRATAFRTIEGFPEVRRPEKFESMPFEFAQLSGRWREQVGWLEAVLAGALDRWEAVEQEGKRKDIETLMTRWAARYADSLRTYALKALARAYVRRRLDQGTRLADLAGDEEAKRFAEACRGQAADIEKFLRARLEDLAAEIETRAIEAPIDSRRHGALADILSASFRFEAVDAERAKSYGDRTDAAWREELEAQRQL